MKTYSIIKTTAKDYIYLLNIDGKTIKLIKPFNHISRTYGAISLTVYDDAFKSLRNNLWLLDLHIGIDLDALLKGNGFELVKPSYIQEFIYN